MSDTRVLSDLALLGVCDQLTDEELVVLSACAEDEYSAPAFLEGHLSGADADVLGHAFASPQGRRQVLEAVELELHARQGGA